MHIMIDLETLDDHAGAAIVSIGACKFYFKNECVIHDTFYTNVDPVDCKKHGLSISKSTLDWWAKQPKETRLMWQKDPKPLDESLTLLDEWWGNPNQHAWCNGMNFDFPILEVAYRKLNRTSPWKHYMLNDFRTMINQTKTRDAWRKVAENDAGYHNALDDSIRQAKFLCSIMGEHL